MWYTYCCTTYTIPVECTDNVEWGFFYSTRASRPKPRGTGRLKKCYATVTGFRADNKRTNQRANSPNAGGIETTPRAFEAKKHLRCCLLYAHQAAKRASTECNVWLAEGASENAQLGASSRLPEGPASCSERGPSCRSSPFSSSSSAPRGTSAARAERTPRPPASQQNPWEDKIQRRGARTLKSRAVVTPLFFPVPHT